MITVKEILEYAVEEEHSVLAHMIFWGMTTHGIAPEDDSNKLKDLDYDREAITALVKNNVLGMGQIKLFVVKVSAELFAFYFARNVLEANSHHTHLFFQKPTSIVEAERLLHKSMYLADLDKHMMLVEYRNELLQFPAYIGHAEAGDDRLYRLDQKKGMNRVV